MTREPETIDLGDGVRMDFAWVPPTGPEGFWMGERGAVDAKKSWRRQEEPRHRVQIPSDFYLGVTPVTQAQFGVWAAALPAIGQRPPDGGPPYHRMFKGDHRATHMVSWRDAVMFCGWLTERCLTTGAESWCAKHLATLPTEAEWEYACRAGTTTEYCGGDDARAVEDVGWFGTKAPPNVGKKRPNTWGLYDLHGNVTEWCWDEWDDAAYARQADGAVDSGRTGRAAWLRAYGASSVAAEAGLPDPEDASRVVRGGAWGLSAEHSRSAARGGRSPGSLLYDRGFRVCLVPGPPCGQPVVSGGGARRDAAAQSEGAAAGTAIDLAAHRLPRRGRRR